jgi:amidase
MKILTTDKVNCLTVIMFDEGIAQAKKLDEHFAKTGKVVGPLHGYVH